MPHQYYFLANAEDLSPSQAVLRDDEHHHLSRVLRHRVGDCVWLTDGLGMMFSGTIAQIATRHTIVEIEKQFPNYGEEAFRLTLAQAMPKSARFEWLLEKGTEIGIAAFVPMVTEFSTVKSAKCNLARWQRVIRAALKQCGRSVLPALEKPQPFEKIIEGSDKFTYRWIAHKPAQEGGQSWHFRDHFEISPRKNGLLMIGPEGGFSKSEIKMAGQAGFAFLDLGKRRLRSETAGIIATSLILNQF